jgi:SAM-dependent methyltransferase
VDGYDPMASFDAAAAAIYDDHPRGDEDAAVAFLREAAAGGRALELAVGTGRIALPLAASGVEVHGVDLSPHMVERLRARPGGDRVAVTMGDFADVPVAGSFSLIYLVYNTIYNLLDQDRQVRCFENVAAHLEDGGAFVVEALTPWHLEGLRDNQYVHAERIAVAEAWLDVGRYDPVTQRLDETHVALGADGVRLFPIVTRYIYPSEMDLMARIAGLHLAERFGGWSGEPFTARSDLHVSVYRR